MVASWNGLLLPCLAEHWSLRFLWSILPALPLQAPGLSQHSVQCHYDPGKWDEGLVTFYNLGFFKMTSRWKSVWRTAPAIGDNWDVILSGVIAPPFEDSDLIPLHYPMTDTKFNSMSQLFCILTLFFSTREQIPKRPQPSLIHLLI